jgi:hypothetical protein
MTALSPLLILRRSLRLQACDDRNGFLYLYQFLTRHLLDDGEMVVKIAGYLNHVL